MPAKRRRVPTLDVRPLTPELWPDFERLFGERGACAGCWCMWWRLTRSEFDKRKGEKNRRSMKKLVESGEVPGLLAYSGDDPVAWCSVAPREDFKSLARSRILAPVDDSPVWSVVCFFVRKDFRNRGVTRALLSAAVEYVRGRGGTIVEGYPVEPRNGVTAPVFVFTGIASAFRRAGFREVARRSPTRPVMRRRIRSVAKTGRSGLRTSR
jgi:GNAT superfamily N-acetyltransferase